MNWNGNREYLDHLIRNRHQPQLRAANQKDLLTKRLAKVRSALMTRPFFMPLQFDMNAAGQVSPYRDTTQAQAFDTIIYGIKADVAQRDIVVRRTEDERPLIYVGDEINLYLRSDEIAGQGSTLGGGQLGVFPLPSPLLIPANTRLTVEMFKTDTTADVEQANIVLVGLRVFGEGFADTILDAAEREQIDFFARAREVPQIKFLKQRVNFETAGVGGVARNLFTPQIDEPLLIRGMRTTLRQSEVVLRVQGEPNWTAGPTPIWGMAAEDDLVHENYQWFAKPVYLHSRTSIEIETVRNSIDGVNIDAQTGNTITWICETV